MSPLQRPISSSSSDDNIPSLSLGGNRAASLAPSTSEGSTVVHLGIPASSFHYQAKGLRVPYLEEKVRYASFSLDPPVLMNRKPLTNVALFSHSGP
jgi:hypothetical protein